MNENKSVNQKCMENVLCHLTKLIVLTEPGETDELRKLVKLSASVSAQLLGIFREENHAMPNENDCEGTPETALDETEEYME